MNLNKTRMLAELVENFKGRAKEEEKIAMDARIRESVWDEAATLVSIVRDRIADNSSKKGEG